MSRSYRVASTLLRVLTRAFFRRVEVAGLEHVPRGVGGILVAWHPNGLIDPALIVATFPRGVVMGARHGLFRYPLIGQLLRGLGAVPIVRAMDARGDDAGRRKANRKNLDTLAREIAAGRFTALFPEGLSHDAPHLMQIKTGVARMYYRARASIGADDRPPVILPVGLHYDKKHRFRSSALVIYHPPLVLPAELDVRPATGEPESVAHQRNRELTAQVERALHGAAHATEDWKLHHLMHRCRKLIRAEQSHREGTDPGRPGMQERQLGMARVWAGYRARRKTHAAEVRRLLDRMREYDADLRALGMEDHDLDGAARLGSPWRVLLLVAQIVAVYVILPPLLIVGVVVNAPAGLLVLAIAKRASREQKDVASLKAMAGALAFPLAWLAAGVLAAFGHVRLHAAFPSVPDTPLLAGAFTALLGAVGWGVTLRYGRLARETLRAMRIRLRRRRRWYTVARLRVERRALYDLFAALSEGLDLPTDLVSPTR